VFYSLHPWLNRQYSQETALTVDTEPADILEPEPVIASTSTALSPAVTVAPPKKKGKRQSDEDKCAIAIQQYFAEKASKSSTVAHSMQHIRDDDESYCQMLSDELREIKTPYIKREVKKQLLEVVYAAQEQEEQLAMWSTMETTVAPDACQELPQQETAVTTVLQSQQLQTIDEGAAILLSLSQHPTDN